MRYFLFSLLLVYRSASAQSGCTDPQADNFNPNASQNDGSCTYPITFSSPVFKAVFPDTLKENSGIVKGGNRWWTHNDSGNDHVFYSVQPETGAVLQSVKLKQAHNDDWEDIAASPHYLYIGDIGNNNGDRTDLGVYKVKFTDIGTDASLAIDNDKWTYIPYAYDDQTDFSHQNENYTEFDCEALMHFQSELHLFTKKWISKTTTHYRINQDTHIAETVETFDVKGLITGADVSPDGKTVILLGYNKDGFPDVFVWLLWDFTGEKVFSGNKRKIELGTPLTLGQAEGIGFRDSCTGYITNEAFNYLTIHVDPSVWLFDVCQYLNQTSATHDPTDGQGFSAYPTRFTDRLHFQYYFNDAPGYIRIFDLNGRLLYESNRLPESLDTGDFPSGTYFIEITTGNRIFSVKTEK